jgi:hypothetical protein
MFKILCINLNKQKTQINRIIQIRSFKRQIVPSDFDVEHHKNKIEKNNKKDPIPYFMEQIRKKEKFNIEKEKWCTDNQEDIYNKRED